MSDLGGKLRQARERRGVSLRQIADRTKVSIAALEALERNDASRLPGGIFARALVRSYAQEVGLDPETAVQEAVARFNIEGPARAASAAEPDRAPGGRVPAAAAAAAALLVLALLAAAFILLRFAVSPGRQSAVPGSGPGTARTERLPPDSRPTLR